MFATSCLTLPITSLRSRLVCLCVRASEYTYFSACTTLCVSACMFVGVCVCVSNGEQRVVIHSAVGVMRHVCR